MKFRILKLQVSYGGPPDWCRSKTIYEYATLEQVKQYFKDKPEVDRKSLQTQEDEMGCYTAYRVCVSDLGD